MKTFADNYRTARALGAGVGHSMDVARQSVMDDRVIEEARKKIAEFDRDRAKAGKEPVATPKAEIAAAREAQRAELASMRPEQAQGVLLNGPMREVIRKTAREALMGRIGDEVAKKMIRERARENGRGRDR